MPIKSTNRYRKAAQAGWLTSLLRVSLGFVAGILTLALMVYGAYIHLQAQLPELDALKDIRYQSPMKIYSSDGLLLGQFGEKIRNPLTLDAIPKKVIQGFLAAEDNRFYEHPGVDYQGLLRASVTLLKTGEKRQGGSTITMQVARNFFLSNEKTYLRKVREILLAIKIENELPKDKILEIYLNKIYLGNHAYGVSAAAEVYYGKTVDQLDLAEIAMIAGLPKAPSTFNPIVNPDRALVRRDYVLERMRSLNFIDQTNYESALAVPNTAELHVRKLDIDLPYVAEIIRNEMYQQYGEDAYNNGYRVYSTIDSQLQVLAEQTLRDSLHHFDEERRFRGIRERVDLRKFPAAPDWDRQLANFGKIGYTEPGMILSFKNGAADVYMGRGQRITLGASELGWAHRYLTGPRTDKSANKPLAAGDVIRLRKVNDEWKLTQIPEVGAALVSLRPNDGAVLAIAGGYDFNHSKFNRALQARRQPGSGFKPVIYSAALEGGLTPSSIINDSPVSAGNWHPQNASNRYYGPTPLRTALMYSRNVVAVKLLQKVGIDKAVRLAEDFGFDKDELPRFLPLALGSGSASPLRMAQMYAVFANGGFRIDPYFIDRVESDQGKIIYQSSPATACIECEDSDDPPEGTARRVLSRKVQFMMNSMLQDVVRGGTAKRALVLNRKDIAGKTGTTNDFHDAWFNGYVPGMVTISWFGYDSYKSLGKGQMGGELALPMWITYMKKALQDIPEYEFPLPQGVSLKRAAKNTGKPGGSAATQDYEFAPQKGNLTDDGAPKVKRAKKPVEPRPDADATVKEPMDTLF